MTRIISLPILVYADHTFLASQGEIVILWGPILDPNFHPAEARFSRKPSPKSTRPKCTKPVQHSYEHPSDKRTSFLHQKHPRRKLENQQKSHQKVASKHVQTSRTSVDNPVHKSTSPKARLSRNQTQKSYRNP